MDKQVFQMWRISKKSFQGYFLVRAPISATIQSQTTTAWQFRGCTDYSSNHSFPAHPKPGTRSPDNEAGTGIILGDASWFLVELRSIMLFMLAIIFNFPASSSIPITSTSSIDFQAAKHKIKVLIQASSCGWCPLPPRSRPLERVTSGCHGSEPHLQTCGKARTCVSISFNGKYQHALNPLEKIPIVERSDQLELGQWSGQVEVKATVKVEWVTPCPAWCVVTLWIPCWSIHDGDEAIRDGFPSFLLFSASLFQLSHTPSLLSLNLFLHSLKIATLRWTMPYPTSHRSSPLLYHPHHAFLYEQFVFPLSFSWINQHDKLIL